MKKSTLAIALAATLAPAASAFAQSNATISGTLDVFAGTRQLAGSARATRLDSGGLTTSQVNISGQEDLGGGLRAEYALGMFLRVDTGEPGRFAGDAFFGRSSYVGVSAPWGTLRLGRQTTGTFLNFIRANSFGDSAVFGPAMVHTWISAIAQGASFVSAGAPTASRALTGALGTTDTAWNNTVGYTSPSMSGVTVNAQWAPGEASGVGARVGLSAFYAGGPLSIGLATERFGRNTVPASGPAAAAYDSMRHWSLNAAYAFSFARLSAGYMQTQRDFTSIVDDRIRTWHVGANVPIGFGSLMWQTAKSHQELATGAATDRTTTSIGWDYSLSKRTDLYLVAMNDRFTGVAGGNSLALGLRHRF